MNAKRAQAYRYILYLALVDIRGLTWFAWRQQERWNPFFLMKSIPRIRAAGALAEWLHNLGQFSSNDFQGFDEERFWQDYEKMHRSHGALWHHDYRLIFDEHLARSPKADA